MVIVDTILVNLNKIYDDRCYNHNGISLNLFNISQPLCK